MLGRALAMEWMPVINFLGPTLCVTENLSAYVGEGLSPSVHTIRILGWPLNNR